MKKPIPEGLLIAVEGIDGAGKTSVAAGLAQWCGERGLLCCLSKEPTGVGAGATLRESAKIGRLTLDEELRLFMADREQHVERTITPALREGAIVILDRYYWSTAAYQGARGADPVQVVKENEAFAPRADLLLLLDVDPGLGLSRIRTRGDQPNEFEKVESLALARKTFLDLASEEPAACVLDATQEARTIFKQALSALKSCARKKIAQAGYERHRGTADAEWEAVLRYFDAS